MSYTTEPVRWMVTCETCLGGIGSLVGYIDGGRYGKSQYTPDAGNHWFSALDGTAMADRLAPRNLPGPRMGRH